MRSPSVRPLSALFLPLLAWITALACAAPGVEISPLPGDFAFVEVDLRG
jgi:hypothetical protein